MSTNYGVRIWAAEILSDCSWKWILDIKCLCWAQNEHRVSSLTHEIASRSYSQHFTFVTEQQQDRVPHWSSSKLWYSSDLFGIKKSQKECVGRESNPGPLQTAFFNASLWRMKVRWNLASNDFTTKPPTQIYNAFLLKTICVTEYIALFFAFIHTRTRSGSVCISELGITSCPTTSKMTPSSTITNQDVMTLERNCQVN